MKAIVQDTYGPPDVLELRDINKPVVGDDDGAGAGSRSFSKQI